MGQTNPPHPDSGWNNWPTAGFRVDAADGYVVVGAYGEIDVNNFMGLVQALDRARRLSAHVLVDLGHVTFIDSTGLGALIAVRRSQARTAVGSLTLVHPPQMLRKVLATVRLDQALPMFDSLQQAVDAIRAAELTPHAGDPSAPPASAAT